MWSVQKHPFDSWSVQRIIWSAMIYLIKGKSKPTLALIYISQGVLINVPVKYCLYDVHLPKHLKVQ